MKKCKFCTSEKDLETYLVEISGKTDATVICKLCRLEDFKVYNGCLVWKGE